VPPEDDLGDPSKDLPRRPGGPSGRGGRRLRQGAEQGAEALGSVLDGLVGSPAWRSGIQLGRLGRSWAAVVGDRLAGESEPVSLERGTLLVRVSSPAWAQQVRFLAEQVRARANEVLGPDSVAQVRVVADPDRGLR
jgi:predicted nucleic acid-binding Zn ribbon protein